MAFSYVHILYQNLPEYLEKIANFLGVQRKPEFLDEVAAKCDFKVHYKERTTNVEEFIAKYSRDTTNFLYRKGTHWTTEIVNMLLQGTNKFAPLSIFTECMLKEQFESMKSPRILCTHLPLRYLPPDILKKAKIIWCLRNPKDVAVSLHNLNKQLSFVDYNASFGEYLQNFLSGEIPTGKWFDHAREWERDVGANKSAPILPVMYEDMKANLPEYVEKIANFLGVQRNPEFFDEVAAKCDFKVQYKERTTNVEEFIAKYSRDTTNFLYRKGQVGDWKNWFTVAQNEQFDKVYEEHMKGSKLKIKFTLD